MRYVEHYRALGESRIYPERKAGSGLVCARCGERHDEGYDAYERYLQAPPAERASWLAANGAAPQVSERPQPAEPRTPPAPAASPTRRVDGDPERASGSKPSAERTPAERTPDERPGGGSGPSPRAGGGAATRRPALAVRWLGALIDAILALVRRKVPR